MLLLLGCQPRSLLVRAELSHAVLHAGAPKNEALHRVKMEGHAQTRRVVAFAAGDRDGVGAMHSNSETACIAVAGGNTKEEVLEQLDIREREQAVRQKEIQTVQMEIGVILPLISSEAIPPPEKVQLRSYLYAKLAKAGLTDGNIVST